MGNQEVRSAMSKIRAQNFNMAELNSLERKLWQAEATLEQLADIKNLLDAAGSRDWSELSGKLNPISSALNVELSGIDSDNNRYSDQAKDCWQSGFSTSEKKLETLKQGDYKQLVIPTNTSAAEYIERNNLRTAILISKLYSRHKSGPQAKEEDILAFLQKFLAEQGPEFSYESALGATMLATPQTLAATMQSSPHLFKSTVSQLLALTETMEPVKKFELKATTLSQDFIHEKLRRVVLSAIERADTDPKTRELSIKLLLRQGLLRASAEDLLLAARLQSKHGVDVARELEALCKTDETFTPTIEYQPNLKLERIFIQEIQEKPELYRGGVTKVVHKNDQLVTDGTDFYIYCDQRGLAKGSKTPGSGPWTYIKQNDDKSLKEMTMLCHRGELLVRHSDAPNAPFQVFSKQTLKLDEAARPYSISEVEEEQDLLNWTPLETEFSEDTSEGNRWMRAAPMCSDGDNIYLLVQYKEKGFTSRVVKTVLETYSVDSRRRLKRTKQTKLFKTKDARQPFLGFKRQISEGYLMSQGNSMACNGATLVFNSFHKINCFDLSTGGRIFQQKMTDSAKIWAYDAIDNFFYTLESTYYCTSLGRYQQLGYKPRDADSGQREQLPHLPVVLKDSKELILQLISDEEKVKAVERGRDNLALYSRYMVESLVMQAGSGDDDEGQINNLALPSDEQLAEESKHGQPENIHEVCKAIILSKMSIEAVQASERARLLRESSELSGQEMFAFFRAPYAIKVSSNYLVQIREALEESFDGLNNGRITLIKQSIVLSLLHIFEANINCLIKCRLQMNQVLPLAELKKIQQLQERYLRPLQSLGGQAAQPDGDLTSEELFQIHIVSLASQLDRKLICNLNFQTRAEKLDSFLTSIQSAASNESSAREPAELKKMEHSLFLMSNQKVLQDIFDGSREELDKCEGILRASIQVANRELLRDIKTSTQSRVFNAESVISERGTFAGVLAFVKTFCNELMFVYGSQILVIEESKNDVESNEMLSEDELATKIEAFQLANAKKHLLESLLYQSFKVVSSSFKSLMHDLTRLIQTEKVYEWSEQDQISDFYSYLKALFCHDSSLLRVLQLFSLMIVSHRAEEVWLDEIAEALKDCALALDAYILMCENLPNPTKEYADILTNSFMQLVQETQRQVCHAIGFTSYRLMLLNEEESNEGKKMSKLNLLQGGIETRFIPSLSAETKLQIERSFKITSDKQLQDLTQMDSSQVEPLEEDTMLSAILAEENQDSTIELAIQILQEGLIAKMPMRGAQAKIGGAWGMRLTRATFAVMLKFSGSLMNFGFLLADIYQIGQDIGDSVQGQERVENFLQYLRDIESNEHYESMSQKWEKASQMRQWTQVAKNETSERLKKEIEKQVRSEINEANPAQEPLDGPLTAEQEQLVIERFDERFDREIEEQYSQVIAKARFLTQLAVPQSIIEAQKAELLLKKQRFSSVRQSSVFRMSQVFKSQARASQRDLTSISNGSQLSSKFGYQIESPLLRTPSVLIKQGKINKKDAEYDWRDRLKKWKSMQKTAGSVTSFEEQTRLQNSSVVFSVLGCLQASFSAEQLKQRIEKCLIYGLRRSAGLNLLNFALNLSYNLGRFGDLIQWLQGALRNNRVQTTHYLTGLEGCGAIAEEGIRKQFFEIIENVVHRLKHAKLSSDDYVHLLNALCWNYTREDHRYLTKIDIFRTLYRGDGTILHPLYRAWGQEVTNFSLELHKREKFCLASRLRQVFEFFTHNILDSIFIAREHEEIDLGQQAKMHTKQDSLSKESSEKLLASICEVLFANLNRYIRMKKLFPDDHVIVHNSYKFWSEVDENNQDSQTYPHDIAHYINNSGGVQIVKGKVQLDKHMNFLKVQMFIQRVSQASPIDMSSPLASQIKKVTRSTLQAESSLEDAVAAIVNRKFKVLQQISSSSWEELGLEEPELSIDEQSKIVGITLKEMEKLTAALLKREEELKKKQQLEEEQLQKLIKQQSEEEEKKAMSNTSQLTPGKNPLLQSSASNQLHQKSVSLRQGSGPLPTVRDIWICSFCTFENTVEQSNCELCMQPQPCNDPGAKTTNWNCMMCTYENQEADNNCEMCQAEKPKKVDPALIKSQQMAAEEMRFAAAAVAAAEEENKRMAAAAAAEEKKKRLEASAAASAATRAQQRKTVQIDTTGGSSTTTKLLPQQPKQKKSKLKSIFSFFSRKSKRGEPKSNSKSDKAKAEEMAKLKIEEKKEEENFEEEELRIIAEDNYEVRCKKYFDFLQSVQKKKEDDEFSFEAKIKVDGKMYTEASLFRIIRALDLIISLSLGRQEGLNIIQRVSDPDYLKQIIELSVEASIHNQILVQKILQNILRFNLPQEILETSVKLAQKPISATSGPNSVEKLLTQPSSVKISASPFLQLTFNRIERARQQLYQASKEQQPGLNSVIQESVRTIRVLFTECNRNQSLRQMLTQTLTANLESVQDKNEAQIDSIMSMIPEAAFLRLSVGTPCVNKDGKVFCVLGTQLVEQGKYHKIQLFPSPTLEKQSIWLAGLYYDPNCPERQDVYLESMLTSEPLLDLDQETTESAAWQSMFMNADLVRKLLDQVMAEDSAFAEPQSIKQSRLLKTYVMRAIFNMIGTLQSQYVDFLQNNSLMARFLEFLLKTASLKSVSPDEDNVNSLLLELRADYLRETVMSSNKLSFGDQTNQPDAVTIFSSRDGRQLFVKKGNEPGDLFYFKVGMQLGKGENEQIEGTLAYLESDPHNSRNGRIFVVEPAKLMNLSQTTLKILSFASVVITDKSIEFDVMLKSLKEAIMKDEKWRACLKTRFIALASYSDFSQLVTIMSSGSWLKNTDIFSRAYLLSQILKHVNPQIWSEVSKEEFKKKFADFDQNQPISVLRDDFVPQTLARMIEDRFVEDESFMLQISLSETMQRIREEDTFLHLGTESKESLIKKKQLEAASRVQCQSNDVGAEDWFAQELMRQPDDSTPDFCTLLTQTDKLRNEINSGFFEEVANQTDYYMYQNQFKRVVYTVDSRVTSSEIADNYSNCLQSLHTSYSRQILLSVLAHGAQSLDSTCRDMLRNEHSFGRLCDLIHTELEIAAHINEFFGNPANLHQVSDQVREFLQFTEQIPGFKTYFFKDLLKRGQLTLQKAAENDFAALEEFRIRNLRKVMRDTRSLDPLCLIQFVKIILEMQYFKVAEPGNSGRPQMTLKALFDLSLGYALVFKHKFDFQNGLELLKVAKQCLLVLQQQLFDQGSLEQDERLCVELFNSRLVSCLAASLQVGEDRNSELKERQKHAINLITQLVRVQMHAQRKLQKSLAIGFEQSPSLKRAIKVQIMIEEGASFFSLINKLKLKILLDDSSESYKIAHLAQRYASDLKSFDTKFKKTVVAETPLVIKVDRLTSNQIIEIKKTHSKQDMILADAATMKSSKSLLLSLDAGESATIEFPIKTETVSYVGNLNCRDYNLQSSCLKTLDDSTQCSIQQVYSCHRAALFVGENESLWGIGYRAQGDAKKWRLIEKPENCRNYKKVVHGKFNRLILTEDGTLFFNGQNRKFMIGQNVQKNSYVSKFHQLEDNFLRLEEGDKIVDVAAGKQYMAVATAQGKIYASGFLFYRSFRTCRYNRSDCEDFPYELRMPAGYKAISVFAAEKVNNLWVNAVDGRGVMRTFGAGAHEILTGHGRESRASSFTQLDLPEGVYMSKITCQGYNAHGLDNQSRLWIWGTNCYAKDNSDDRREMFGENVSSFRSPRLMTWFSERELHVLDIASSRDYAIVKVKDKDGKLNIFGLSTSSDRLSVSFGARASLQQAFKHYIVEIPIEASRVKHFAMSLTACFFVMAREEDNRESIDPRNPNERGLIHFYQQPTNRTIDGKRVQEWRFLSPQDYEAQKNGLPRLCFATRHPIEWLKEKLKVQQSAQSSQNDRLLLESKLPDLQAIEATLGFDPQLAAHSVKTSSLNREIGRNEPLYFSKAVISGKEKTIVASAAEVFEGGQPWDLDPHIFYRVNSPATSVQNLPTINLAEHFKQSEGEQEQMVSFTIMKAALDNSEIDSIVSEQTVQRLQAVANFTQEQDQQILQQLDSQIEEQKLDLQTCKSSNFSVKKDKLKLGSSLLGVDQSVIDFRAMLLVKYSKVFLQAFKFVSFDDRFVEGSLSALHYVGKALVVPSVTNKIVDERLDSISEGGYCEISVNRKAATEFAAAGKIDQEGKYSIYGQIVSQLKQSYPTMTNFRQKSVDSRCYQINLRGEGSIDAGGPFRDSLVNIVQEMEDGLVPLLIKSPNNRNEHGSNRNCFVLNPDSTSPTMLELFKYLGGFIAFGILSKSPVPLNLAPTVWKQILGEKMGLADLEAIDTYSFQVLSELKTYSQFLSDEEFESTVNQTFTTVLSNGAEISLCPDGEHRKVKKQEIDEFINLVVQARFDESFEQIKAVQDGLNTVLQGNLKYVSYLTCDAIEERACGSKIVDIDRFKSITSFNCSANHEIVGRFWRVFESFSGEERALYLKFVWGRNRLPYDLTKISRKHEIRLISHMNDKGYPQSHTCYNQLDIPFYKTDEDCRRLLLQAISYCGGIDTDHDNVAE